MAHLKSPVLLVVEDESIVARDLQQALIDLGYDAYATAATAEEALARAAERRPDLALVDVRIKGRLDGIKTAQLLRERYQVPVVYLTAHADDATVVRAKQTRPYGYLVKPVKPVDLRSAIEIALYAQQVDGRAGGPDPSPAGGTAAAEKGTGRTPRAPAVRRQLEQILSSPDFDAARRSREFLCFIVEETLGGRSDGLTQGAIATRVFGRKDDFDATLDPIVRIQAGRLRRSLERYYLLGGKGDGIQIDLPRGSYVPAFQKTPAAEAPPAEREPPQEPEAAPGRATAPASTDPWPTMTVGAFEETEGDSERVAARFEEELAVELGRYCDVRVLLQRDEEESSASSHPRPRFELRGRLQHEGGTYQVTARLLDRTSGEQVWGDRYLGIPGQGKGSLDDVARVVAARVGAEHGVLVQTLASEYRRRPLDHRGAYAAILRAQLFLFARDVLELGPAMDELKKVVAKEPEVISAWTLLSRLSQTNYAFELSNLDTPIDDAIAFAYQAARLDPASARIRCVLAAALLNKGELRTGRDELEEALRLNPESLAYREMIGWLLALLGDWERGIAMSRDAIERNPYHMPHVYLGFWADHLRRGEHMAAYRAALEFRDPAYFWRALMRASALGHLERHDEAEAEVIELLRVKPDFAARGRILIGHYIKPGDLLERVAEGLRKAGLELA